MTTIPRLFLRLTDAYKKPALLLYKKDGRHLSFSTAGIREEVDRSTPGLAPYEKVKKIALLGRDFEIEEGETTPTLKVKRNVIEKKYKDFIESLYRD